MTTSSKMPPGQELITKEEQLPATGTTTFINRVTRTVWGAERATNLANSHTTMFDAFARAEESFMRLATTERRMRNEFTRDDERHAVDLTKLQAERLEYEMQKQRLEFEQANLELMHQLAIARVNSEIRGYEKQHQPPAPESTLSDDPKVRQVHAALKRHDEIAKLKPEFDRRKKEVERQREAGEISAETAQELIGYLDNLYNQLVKP